MNASNAAPTPAPSSSWTYLVTPARDNAVCNTQQAVANSPVLLTVVPFGTSFCRTEPRNSASSGNRTRQTCGFFAPGVYVGRVTDTTPRMGKEVRCLLAVSSLPTPMGAAHRNVSPWSSRPAGDVVMANSTGIPPTVSRHACGVWIAVHNRQPWQVASDRTCTLGHISADAAQQIHGEQRWLKHALEDKA